MSNEELCILIQNNDSSAFNKLYENNVKLLHSLINRFYFNKDEKEDLLSVCKISLLNAALKYNPSFNTAFTTYAVPLILGEIKKHFRQSFMHVSRGVKDLYRKIMIAQEELMIINQREITLNEVAKYLNVSIEEVIFAYESNAEIISLDAPFNEEGDLSLIDLIQDRDNESLKNEINLALDKLTKKERMIIDLRYYKGYSQEEVSKRLFTSQVQVSRIEKKILEKLKLLI